MPSESIFPVLRYRDARAAIDWLAAAFGFEPGEVTEGADGAIVHAELALGSGVVMLGGEGDDERTGGRAGRGWVYVALDDPDAHHERARSAGAEIVFELTTQSYGAREYTARDPEGNLWSFGTYRPGA